MGMVPLGLLYQVVQRRYFADARAVGNACQCFVAEHEGRSHILEKGRAELALHFVAAPMVELLAEIKVGDRGRVVGGYSGHSREGGDRTCWRTESTPASGDWVTERTACRGFGDNTSSAAASNGRTQSVVGFY